MNGFMTSKMNTSHFADMVHLNEVGYAKISVGIAEKLNELYDMSYAR